MSDVLTLWPTCRNPTFPAKVPNISTKQIILLLKVWYSHAESIILSAANSGGYKKTTIGDCQYHQFMTLINSASKLQPIGLPPMRAKFCHTLNTLLVERWPRRAWSWLNFSSSAAGRLVGWQSTVVGRSTMKTAMLWLLEGLANGNDDDKYQQTTTNQKHMGATEEEKERRCDWGGSAGEAHSIEV
jgi:hypothetical protein